MPIIEAMLVTKTDISIACERPKISAPVTSTETKPSASGSVAAASEPKTASRISSTIGKPADSAFARSSLERSCIAAHSAPWPTKWVATPSCGPSATASSLRRSTATAVASSSSTARRAGRPPCRPRPRPAPRAARGARRRARRRRPAPAARRAARSRRRSCCAASRPRCGISTAASWARWTPGKRSSASSTAADCEPGTPKPPLERSSDWRAANGRAARRTTAQRRGRRACGGAAARRGAAWRIAWGSSWELWLAGQPRIRDDGGDRPAPVRGRRSIGSRGRLGYVRARRRGIGGSLAGSPEDRPRRGAGRQYPAGRRRVGHAPC